MTTRRSLSEWVYGRILRLYPTDFRREFGPDMRDVFRDHYREARRRSGLAGVAALWFRTVPDLLFTGLHEHEDHMLEAVTQDARYAVRILRKNPVFALIAILVVALGTGAVSTIFSVANAIVLRPIPGVARPDAVVSLTRMRRDGASSRSASYPYYDYISSRSKTMSGIAAWDMMTITIGTDAGAEVAQLNLVSSNYFDVLGVKPALGRFFAKSEAGIDATDPIVVLSNELWQRRFNGDSGVVGKQVLVNGKRFSVIGVAPRRFSGLYPVVRVDAWTPMSMQPLVRRGDNLLRSAGSGWLELTGRLGPGVSTDAARAELAGLTKQYSAASETGPLREMAEYSSVRLEKIAGLPADATTPILAFFVVLIAVSGLVLLIASVNVASMLLARGVARRREITVRIALGASRARLVRQLLVESVLLFTAGGIAGTLLAIYATRLLGRLQLPLDVPLSIDPAPDARVMIVTLLVSMVTGIVFGLAPALQSSRGDLATTFRGDSPGGGRHRSRLRNALVAGQVAASLLLLTASGLFVRALARGHRVDPGYDITHVATASLDVSLSGYDSTRARVFYTALRDRVRGMPGVTAVAYTRVLPLSMNNSGYDIAVPGYQSAKGSSQSFSNANLVSEGYFDVLKLPILSGRAFLASDDAAAPRVAVVSRLFAEKYWPGQSPLGHAFKLDSSTVVTIVGVTSDVKFSRLDERAGPFVYMPIAQHWRSDLNLIARTSSDAAQLATLIRAEVRAMDPVLPPATAVTLERASVVVLLPQRFAVIVTASLGVLGLLLAAIGLYGVLAFSAAQRTREIGVRMALGAVRKDVIALIVREGMRVVGVGVVVGIVLAVVASQALAPFLFGVNPLDAVTYVGVTALLLATATLACLLPARRASNADPMAALRE